MTLVEKLLKQSTTNKTANDAARRDYSRQYGSYMDVLKASGYIPDSDGDKKLMGLDKVPLECALPVFSSSSVCLSYKK